MRRIFTTVLARTALFLSIIGPSVWSHGASAAPVTHRWTGFYFGGSVGYHWGKDDVASSANPAGWTTLAPFVNGTYPATLAPKGFIGGVQGGINWQTSNFLFG